MNWISATCLRLGAHTRVVHNTFSIGQLQQTRGDTFCWRMHTIWGWCMSLTIPATVQSVLQFQLIHLPYQSTGHLVMKVINFKLTCYSMAQAKDEDTCMCESSRKIVSTDLPNFILAKITYNGNQDNTNKMITITNILITLIFDFCCIRSICASFESPGMERVHTWKFKNPLNRLLMNPSYS